MISPLPRDAECPLTGAFFAAGLDLHVVAPLAAGRGGASPRAIGLRVAACKHRGDVLAHIGLFMKTVRLLICCISSLAVLTSMGVIDEFASYETDHHRTDIGRPWCFYQLLPRQ